MNETPSTLEHQIQQLERELRERRAQLGTGEDAPIQRAEVQQLIGKKIEDAATQHAAAMPLTGEVAAWEIPEISQQVQQLVDLAFTDSVQAAVTRAVQTGSPVLIDALHDVLTDKLHDELMARKLIEPVS